MKRTNREVILDFAKTLTDYWTLHFTDGVYFTNGSVKEIQPFMVELQPKDFKSMNNEIFNLYYNILTGLVYYKNKTEDASCTNDKYIGGFIVDGCDLKFLFPKDQCLRYIREFDDEFTDEFIKRELYDICKYACTKFNISYGDDFAKGCEIGIESSLQCDEMIPIDLYWDIDMPIYCQPNN